MQKRKWQKKNNTRVVEVRTIDTRQIVYTPKADPTFRSCCCLSGLSCVCILLCFYRMPHCIRCHVSMTVYSVAGDKAAEIRIRLPAATNADGDNDEVK